MALRLRRATAESAAAAREAFLAFWREGGETHFDVEEAVLLPALGDRAVCRRVLADHAAIRDRAAALAASGGGPTALQALGRDLAEHVRLEERELFPLLEDELEDAELTRLAERCRAQEQSAAIRRA